MSKVIEVKNCTECPVMNNEFWRCQLEDEEAALTEERPNPPKWCPLRFGEVTLKLTEDPEP